MDEVAQLALSTRRLLPSITANFWWQTVKTEQVPDEGTVLISAPASDSTFSISSPRVSWVPYLNRIATPRADSCGGGRAGSQR